MLAEVVAAAEAAGQEAGACDSRNS
jgi:hypothetical protein